MSNNIWYLMNTHTRVHADDPGDNEFDHDDGVTFLILHNLDGKAYKVAATYGLSEGADRERPGHRIGMVQDTGLGHRYMPDHIVAAVIHPDGKIEGDVPNRRLPYWVAK